MESFDFERSKNSTGGLQWTAYDEDGDIICQIANLHTFNVYPTDGRKYGVEVRGNAKLSGRNFRRLRDAKHYLDSNYELIMNERNGIEQ